MMNAKRSSNLNLTRYAFLVPVVVVCLFTFSLSKAEVVKTSPAFKAVTDVVENIKSMALNADTTPVKKTVKKTTTTKKTNAGDAVKKAFTTTTDNTLPNQGSATELLKNVENTTVRVRGINPGDSVVTVIDGKIFTGDVNKIDPKTIKSISVIKDNATAYLNQITGSNASADSKSKGLIVITTVGNPNGASSVRPGTNNVDVVGYGTNKNEVVVQGFKATSDNKSTGIRFRANALTITGDTTKRDLAVPLIVVDGKIATEKVFEQVNQDDIESMTVLKGATAVTYYGEKAKNGAIVITTKKK